MSRYRTAGFGRWPGWRSGWQFGGVLLVTGCLSRPLEQEEARIGRTPITRRPVPATVAPAPGSTRADGTAGTGGAATAAAAPSAAAGAESPFPLEWGGVPRVVAGDGPLLRVALRVLPDSVTLGAAGDWRLLDAMEGVLVRARATDRWTVQRRGTRLRAVHADGSVTAWHTTPMTQRAEAGAPIAWNGAAYRGALQLIPTDSGILVVNLVPLEAYLRGVVPLEIGGTRGAADEPAVEAQAIAARSYAAERLLATRAGRPRHPHYDLLATTADQVYGGVAAERPLSDEAVAHTAGLVLLLDGALASAPDHSSCGGRTAAASDAWRGPGARHLQEVSDRIPGTDRHYCELAPRFAWTRTFTSSELDAVMARYLARYSAVGPAGPGRVTDLVIDDVTTSGRVGTLVVRATGGSYRVRGVDARSLLRSAGGEALNSSYFSVAAERAEGRLTRVVLRGRGYGHGVGMCQWGAIGRARAGQDARTILATYYPGTTIGPIPQ
ncbi:MAG: SpoIID/LytB domain-containing protein [Gemmatimonadota bacterium]